MNKTNLSPFFQTTPNLQDVLPYTEKDVLETIKRENVYPQYTNLSAPEVMDQDRWLAYAVHHAVTKFPKAKPYDQYAFAGMTQGVYSGLFGGFGTDDARQEKIEGQTLFLNNRLNEFKVTNQTKAKIILLFLEDKYFNQ